MEGKGEGTDYKTLSGIAESAEGEEGAAAGGGEDGGGNEGVDEGGRGEDLETGEENCRPADSPFPSSALIDSHQPRPGIMNKASRVPLCSSCQSPLQQGWTLPCGHVFCHSCLTVETTFTCPIDLVTYQVSDIPEDQALSEAIRLGELDKVYERINTEGVPCPAGAFCEGREYCPYSHTEEDLFKSMAPVFPDAVQSGSARSGLEAEVLNEYLDIEGVEESVPQRQDYLQDLTRQVKEKVGMAYLWLRSL